MFLRNKVTVIILTVLFLTAIKINSLPAAWWQFNDIPVPANTEEVKKEKRELRGAELEVKYYLSSLSLEEVKNFYKQKLAAGGWTENELKKQVQSIPGTKEAMPSLNSMMDNNVMYMKDNETFILTFVPAGFLQDNRTRYTISKGNMAPKPGAESSADYISKLQAKPKKDVAPVYPGASLISLSEQEYSSRQTYFTKDDIDTVSAFFKEKMPGYGWWLVKEAPFKKLEYSGMDISQYCPSCAKNNASSDKPVEVWNGALDFSNKHGDVCRVVLSDVSPVKKSLYATSMTTILIGYDEKKE